MKHNTNILCPKCAKIEESNAVPFLTFEDMLWTCPSCGTEFVMNPLSGDLESTSDLLRQLKIDRADDSGKDESMPN